MSTLGDIWGSSYNPFNGNLFKTIPSTLQGAFNDWTGKTSAEQAQRNWEKQMALSKEQLYRGHQIETQDLINAGINPILTATSGGAKTTLPGLPDSTNIGGEGAWNFVSSALGKGVDFRGQQSQAGLNTNLGVQALATAGNEKSLAGLHNQQAKTELLNQGLTATQTGLALQQIQQSQATTQHLRKQVDFLNEQIPLIKEQVKNAGTDRDRTVAETKLTQVKQELYKTLKYLGIAGDIAFLAPTGVGMFRHGLSAVKAVKNSKYGKVAIEPIKKGFDSVKSVFGLGSKVSKFDTVLNNMKSVQSVKNGFVYCTGKSGKSYALKYSTVKKNGTDWLSKYLSNK